MSNSAAFLRLLRILGILVLIPLAGCFSARGLPEIRSEPYPVIYRDDGGLRFGDSEENVFIEVRRAPISKKIDNLAIRYSAFFPGGVKITPGDHEEYVTVAGKKAYKVVFQTSYIRKRKRVKGDASAENLPKGWSLQHMVDPSGGASIPVLLGPIVPRERILYLVEGKSYVYYIFMRADGESIGPAKEKFEKLLNEDIDYG